MLSLSRFAFSAGRSVSLRCLSSGVAPTLDESILNPRASYPEWLESKRCSPDIQPLIQQYIQTPSSCKFYDLVGRVGAAGCSGPDASPALLEGFIPYKTRPHLELYSILAQFSSLLADGMFRGSRGEQSRLICGPKGIGKSASLSVFTCISPLIHDSIIPLYISYNGIAENERLRTDTIGDIVYQELGCVLGFAFEPPGSSPITLSISALRKAGKRCLLIIDELDQFYASNIDPNLQLKSLGQLKMLAEDFTGSFSTMICGSSTSLPHLITAHRHYYDGFETKFPLVKISPSLNNTKFEEIRLSVSPPNDLDVLKSILGENTSLATLNMCCFFGGTNPRHLRKFMHSMFWFSKQYTSSVTTEEQYINFANHILPTSYRAVAFDTYENTSHIHDKLMLAMYNKNRSLFSGRLDARTITESDWTQFKPLTYAELQDMSKHEHGGDIRKFRQDLLNLTDRMWIVPATYESGIPSQIYPMTMFQVAIAQDLSARSSTSIVRALKNAWDGTPGELLRQGAMELVKSYMRSGG